MSTQNVARIYAKSITELAVEYKVDIANEFARFNDILNENDKFEALLFLDVFTIDEKLSVVDSIFEKVEFAKIFKVFLVFILQEKRAGLFPQIYKEVIVIDDAKRGFMRGVVEGTEDELDSAFKMKIQNYLQEKLGKETQLEYQKNDGISAGYRVTVGDLQLDASLDNQLEKLKTTILDS
jgi:F-type H+-transporting ATPase subunit delta